MTEEGDRLNSLYQTHFISEDAIQIVVIQTDKPVETYHLIGFKLAALDHLRLLLYLLLDSVSNGVINLARVFEVGFDLFIFRKILLSFLLFIVVILHFLGELLPVRPYLVSIDPSCLLAKHLLFPVLMFELLETDLGTELFQVLMSLLEDLQEPRILLSIDHVDVGVEVIVLEGLDAVTFLLVLRHLFLFLLGLKRGLDELGLFADVVDLLFVELCELFGMEEDLVEEFLVASFLAQFLA